MALLVNTIKGTAGLYVFDGTINYWRGIIPIVAWPAQ
jgi:hypothetical protein